MNAKITRLFDRVKRLGIGEPTEYVSLFESFADDGRHGCSYWTQERFREFSDTHPEENRVPGALKVLSVGCPKLDESDWCGLGSAKYDADGLHIPSPERPCAECEFLIPAIKKEKIEENA